MEWALEHSRAKPTARFVLVAIASHADEHGRNSYPSSATLQRRTGLSERAIREAVKELTRIGELKVAHGVGPKGCNVYWIIMTPAGDAASTESPRHQMPPAPDAPPADGASSTGAPDAGLDLVAPASGAAPPAGAAVSTGQELPPNSPSIVKEQSFFKTHTADDGGLFDVPAEAPPKPKRRSAPTGPPQSEIDAAFARFWEAYPRKVSRGDAVKAFTKVVKSGTDLEAVIAGAQRYRDDGARQRSEIKYTKHAATWLNGQCWLDEVAPPSRASPNGHQPYRNPADSSIYEGDL